MVVAPPLLWMWRHTQGPAESSSLPLPMSLSPHTSSANHPTVFLLSTHGVPLPCVHRPRPTGSTAAVDLAAYLNTYGRLPQLGDDPPPWRYRGWLLPYVHLQHAWCPAV